MDTSEETCLLCLTMNKNMISFYSETGKELNILSILSTHFWFQFDEIKVLSQNICLECWKQTETFHEFYQSVRAVHKKFETVFVKIENDLDIVDNQDGEFYHHDSINEFLQIENDQDVEDDESIHEVPYTNSIDTETGAFDILPKNTQSKYLRSYEKLLAWKTTENIEKDCFSEAVMLEYFYYLKSKYKPSSLWVEYSMLRTTIQNKDNVDISYPEVSSLLKKSSAGYHSQTISVFQPDELRRFLSEADDIKYLDVKVITIFGIYGATRGDTLTKISVNDVSEHGSVLVIKFPEPKTNIIRSFTLENEYAEYVQKYKNLRPENVQHTRFFLNYQYGKCTVQPIGRNKFLNAPKVLAKFLKLKDAENYTLHSFRKRAVKRSEQTNCKRFTEGSSLDASDTIGSTSPTTSNKIGESAVLDELPEKSREKYIRSYDNLMAWKTGQNIDKECFSKEVMLEYFNYMKTKYKPSSLMVEYSVLRTTIQRNNNVDIFYPELTSFLKINSVFYNPQKTNVFEADEMRRFLYEAQDFEYLAVKVIMIFGMYGATHADTLTKVDVKDVNEQGSVLVIKIPESRTNAVRSFTLENEHASCVRKYKKLRPKNVPHSRFFINHQNGKCTVQPIGRNKFLNAPKVVANFLNLEDADNYTCHSFRRKTPRRRRRGRCSPSQLDSFIEECIPIKRKTDDHLELSNFETSTEAMDTSSGEGSSAILSTENNFGKDTKALELLPGKSREKYIRSYENFLAWKIGENIDKDCFSEDIMLEYFNVLKPKYKPSSLWVEYSMLRTTIQKNDNIDIGYPSVKSFLKDISVGFHPQKSNVFRPDELRRFLSEAEDIKFLAVKVIVVFGICGATSTEDLTKVDVKDVTDEGLMTTIKIPERKSKVIRSFTLGNEYAAYVQKYKKLRPEDTPHSRFFVNYQNGKCTVQPIGKNKILMTPKVIANFLNLDDADNYTWNNFSRTTKTLLTDGGAEILTSTCHGGLSSLNGEENFMQESMTSNRKITDLISQQMYFHRTTEQMVTSTITSSIDTSAIPSTAFPTYNNPSNQVPPLHYDQKQAMIASNANAFQPVYIPPHQVQPYPHLQHGSSTVNMRPNDGYAAPQR